MNRGEGGRIDRFIVLSTILIHFKAAVVLQEIFRITIGGIMLTLTSYSTLSLKERSLRKRALDDLSFSPSYERY